MDITILKQEVSVTTITVQPGCCKRCGEAYDACKSPISHAIPSIRAIKLPGAVDSITAKYGPGLASRLLTAREREILDAYAIMGHANF